MNLNVVIGENVESGGRKRGPGVGVDDGLVLLDLDGVIREEEREEDLVRFRCYYMLLFAIASHLVPKIRADVVAVEPEGGADDFTEEAENGSLDLRLKSEREREERHAFSGNADHTAID